MAKRSDFCADLPLVAPKLDSFSPDIELNCSSEFSCRSRLQDDRAAVRPFVPKSLQGIDYLSRWVLWCVCVVNDSVLASPIFYKSIEAAPNVFNIWSFKGPVGTL